MESRIAGTPNKKSPARVAASILILLLALRFATQAIGTLILILVRLATPADPAQYQPTAFHAAMIVACGLTLAYVAMSALHFVGTAKLLHFSAAWVKYLLILTFIDAALLLTLNDATIYIVTTVICRMGGVTYANFQRVVNAELAFTVSPAGCGGDACFSVVILGILIALIILLFRIQSTSRRLPPASR